MGWLYRNEPIDDPLAYLKAKYNYDCETHTLADARRRPRRQHGLSRSAIDREKDRPLVCLRRRYPDLQHEKIRLRLQGPG